MYIFRPLQNEFFETGMANLLFSITDQQKRALADGTYGVYMARYRGALLSLFGEPLLSSDILDEAYTYFLEASNEYNKHWLLYVYQGPSGPAIGGNTRDNTILPIALALQELIEQTIPADFDTIMYDDDTDSTVFYGCKNGVCYCRVQSGDHLHEADR